MLFMKRNEHKNLYFFSLDFLKIYDGDTIHSPMVGNPYCGDSLPPSQISSSNHLFIHFYSGRTGTGIGFKMEYNATIQSKLLILKENEKWD